VYRLVFEAEAYDSYLKITDEHVLTRLDDVFDQLERDPGAARVRQHRFVDPPVWCVLVPAAGQDGAVLWDIDREADADATVVVHYLGTANLTI
jgi:hypothetical protein